MSPVILRQPPLTIRPEGFVLSVDAMSVQISDESEEPRFKVAISDLEFGAELASSLISWEIIILPRRPGADLKRPSSFWTKPDRPALAGC